jgi:tetratricopeptide (TPR) repeat protein
MPAGTIEQDADRAAAAGDFAGARAMLERAVEADSGSPGLWMKLAAVSSALGDLQAALAAVERTLSISPLDFSALLFRATLLEKLEDPRAGREFGHALAQCPPDDQIPPSMKPAIERARERWEEYQEQLEALLQSRLPANLDPAEERRVNRFISNRSRRTRRYHQEPAQFDYPEMPEIEFHDREHFRAWTSSNQRPIRYAPSSRPSWPRKRRKSSPISNIPTMCRCGNGRSLTRARSGARSTC